MKHRIPKILYFSLDKKHIEDFWGWIDEKKVRYHKKCIFIPAEAPAEFNNAADLSLYLNQYEGNLQSLHVIVDFCSFKTGLQASYIRDAVIEFPEIQFLFDKHYSPDASVLDFLFSTTELYGIKIKLEDNDKEKVDIEWKAAKSKIKPDLFEIDYSENPYMLFGRIINGFDNTFDASNLRYAIKYWKYLKLKVYENRNFQNLQESRATNIAICVEEEARQNIFTSYALYTNGYRVFSVTTRNELKIVNTTIKQIAGEDGIVFRDYDLQFEDEDEEPIDEIRGYRFCEKGEMEEGSKFAKIEDQYFEDFQKGWNDLTVIYHKAPNNYWSNIINHLPIFFITKGPKPDISEVVHPDKCSKVEIEKDRSKIKLPGFEKPVCGLYRPFFDIKEIKDIYNATRYSPAKDGKKYEIQTSRKDHDHSTPLDIYDLANRMIRRAEKYYESKLYILAALVAGEALEVLNGFHHRLTVKAYYIQAIAENAIAMDVVGGNEEYLAKDTRIRVNKINEDIDRIFFKYDAKNKTYVLNQIYSTCREFCKEHKHFESEEIFISALGHLLEGYPVEKLFKQIIQLFKKSVKQ